MVWAMRAKRKWKQNSSTEVNRQETVIAIDCEYIIEHNVKLNSASTRL